MYSPPNRDCFIFGQCATSQGFNSRTVSPIDSRCSFVFHHPLVGAHHVAAFQRSFQKSLRCFRFRFSTSRRTSLRTNHGPRQVPPVYLRAGLTCVSFCFYGSHRDLLSYSRVSRLALHPAPAKLIWPLLTSGGSSRRLTTPVARRQTTRSPRVLRTHLHAYLCRIYAAASVQVSGFASIGLLTPLRRLYPLAVRQSSVLPPASSGSHLAMDTLAVRLTLPLAGCVEDLHLLVSAPCRAHQHQGTLHKACPLSMSIVFQALTAGLPHPVGFPWSAPAPSAPALCGRCLREPAPRAGTSMLSGFQDPSRPACAVPATVRTGW